jgi:hypothetical protein
MANIVCVTTIMIATHIHAIPTFDIPWACIEYPQAAAENSQKRTAMKCHGLRSFDCALF